MTVVPATKHSPFISIIVPTLNEADYIGQCLDTLVRASEGYQAEILVVDGGSIDETKAIVGQRSMEDASIRLIDNPQRLQSAAVNLGARVASPRADIIIRADAHALYPSNFVTDCIAAMVINRASSVVVPMTNVAGTGLQQAIAAAQSGRFGNGGSAHRVGGRSGFVDHGHHAAFDRATFLRLGGYDPSFTHNEDAEYDVRLALAGGRAWMCHTAVVTYFPRKSLSSLAKQYFRHGKGRARTLLLHRMTPKLRQLAPLAALLFCTAGIALTPLSFAFLLLPGAYVALCLAWAVWLTLGTRNAWLLAAAPAVLVMHMSWACGFITRLIQELSSSWLSPRLTRFFRKNVPQ